MSGNTYLSVVMGPCLVPLRPFRRTDTRWMVSPTPEQMLGPQNTLSTSLLPLPGLALEGREWPEFAEVWTGVKGCREVWTCGVHVRKLNAGLAVGGGEGLGHILGGNLGLWIRSQPFRL